MSNLTPRRGIKHLAQGIALGLKAARNVRPVGAKGFLAALCAVLLIACQGEADAPQGGMGYFSIGLSADSLAVEVETRSGHTFVTRAAVSLTDDEAADFLVTLTQGGDVVWQEKTFRDISLADRTQPLGDGYIVMAENVTATVAETSNNGWGERRFAGESQTFAVNSGETTHVTVPCAMANAGLTVTFDDSFTSYFTEYAVTTDDLRALKFNADNTAAEPAVAYYNPTNTADGTHTLDVIISASAGWDGTVHLTRTLTLRTGKITRLAVKLNSDEPTEGNIDIIAITYDDSFEEGTTEEIILE